MVGRLSYRKDSGRYGFLVGDLLDDGEYFGWDGIHCGDCMQVLVNGEWLDTRMELNYPDEWYLVGTPYRGNLENVAVRTYDHPVDRFDPDI